MVLSRLILFSGLERFFAKNRNYEELKDAWTEYRDATGRKMRDQYIEFVRLGNKRVKLNGKILEMNVSILF